MLKNYVKEVISRIATYILITIIMFIVVKIFNTNVGITFVLSYLLVSILTTVLYTVIGTMFFYTRKTIQEIVIANIVTLLGLSFTLGISYVFSKIFKSDFCGTFMLYTFLQCFIVIPSKKDSPQP